MEAIHTVLAETFVDAASGFTRAFACMRERGVVTEQAEAAEILRELAEFEYRDSLVGLLLDRVAASLERPGEPPPAAN